MMADKIILEIARYSPEHDHEPYFQSFEVPVYKEWVVLDALNHIKDNVDGTLTYRWSCRMGICGSCGMMVNGEPKLTCATFLSSYAKNGSKIRVEPLRYFPVVRDLVDGAERLPGQAEEGEAVADAQGRAAARAGRVSANAGAGGPLQAVQHVHQLHACAMRLVRLWDWIRCSSGRRRSRWRSATTWIRATRARHERTAILAHPDGVWGCTFVGECTRVCPKHVDPAGAIQQYKIAAVLDWLKSFVTPRGT